MNIKESWEKANIYLDIYEMVSIPGGFSLLGYVLAEYKRLSFGKRPSILPTETSREALHRKTIV
jgi:hypothetical protein